MTLQSARLLSLLVVASSVLACSESTETSSGSGGSSGDGGSSSESTAETGAGSTTGSTSSATSSTSSTTTSTSNTSSTGSQEPLGLVVINEIDPDADWIELANIGDAAFDLSGFTLADQEMPGMPKLAEAIQFPAGTSLMPGEFLFVLAKQATSMPGEQTSQTMCDPGPSPCFHAPFGLSGTNGDEVFLIDTADATVTSVAFGANAAPVGSTWCRDSGGNYAVCATPTPGAAN
jgi:hypothetical protein